MDEDSLPFDWLQVSEIYSDQEQYLSRFGLSAFPSLITLLAVALWALSDTNRKRAPTITASTKPQMTFTAFLDIPQFRQDFSELKPFFDAFSFDRFGWSAGPGNYESIIDRTLGANEVIRLATGKSVEMTALKRFPYCVDLTDLYALVLLNRLDEGIKALRSGRLDDALLSYGNAVVFQYKIAAESFGTYTNYSAWQQKIDAAVRRNVGSSIGAKVTQDNGRLDHEFIIQFASTILNERTKWDTHNQAVQAIHEGLQNHLEFSNTTLPSGKRTVSLSTVRTAVKELLDSQPEIFNRLPHKKSVQRP